MKECLDAVSFGVGEAVLCCSRELRHEQKRGATDELGGSVNFIFGLPWLEGFMIYRLMLA